MNLNPKGEPFDEDDLIALLNKIPITKTFLYISNKKIEAEEYFGECNNKLRRLRNERKPKKTRERDV